MIERRVTEDQSAKSEEEQTAALSLMLRIDEVTDDVLKSLRLSGSSLRYEKTKDR